LRPRGGKVCPLGKVLSLKSRKRGHHFLQGKKKKAPNCEKAGGVAGGEERSKRKGGRAPFCPGRRRKKAREKEGKERERPWKKRGRVWPGRGGFYLAMFFSGGRASQRGGGKKHLFSQRKM